MVIEQNIEMRQLDAENNVEVLYPYTKAECVIVDNNGVKTNMQEELLDISEKMSLLYEYLEEVIE